MKGNLAARRAEDEKLSSSDQIVRDIVRGLYGGRFAAGQRLVEPDLVRLYGVSRGTVREAIKRLAAEGVVTQTAFRGAHIRHLSRTEARDILELLEVTIGLAARLAAERIGTPGLRAQIRQSYDRLEKFSDGGDAFDLVRARNRFYRAITQAGGNRELARLLPTFQVHLIRANLTISSRLRFGDYQAIVDAILAGNGSRAETVARRHVRRSLEVLADAPASMFAPDDETSIGHVAREDIDDA